jgi:hypothetical protein
MKLKEWADRKKATAAVLKLDLIELAGGLGAHYPIVIERQRLFGLKPRCWFAPGRNYVGSPGEILHGPPGAPEPPKRQWRRQPNAREHQSPLQGSFCRVYNFDQDSPDGRMIRPSSGERIADPAAYATVTAPG